MRTMATPRPHGVLDLSPASLEASLARMDQPAYRARQILHAIYRVGRRDFASMTDLPADLRRRDDCEITRWSRDDCWKRELG